MEVTSFSCGECEKEFRNEVFLHSHINAYHDKRSFTCEQCQEIVVGNKFFLNHKRNHQGRSDKKVIQRKSTSRSTRLSSKSTKGAPICDKCGKSFSKMSNLVRHKVVHEKERAKFVCNMCDQEFTRKDNLEEHVNSAHVSRPRPNAIITEAVFKKEETLGKERETFACEKCNKYFPTNFNLRRHLRKHRTRNRWAVMRKVKKMICDAEIAREMRNKLPSEDTEAVDETYVETVMKEIPNMSNRQILKTLTILRKTLPKEYFKKNLRSVIQARTNLLDDFFTTENAIVKNSKGKSLKMPVTRAKDLNTLIMLVCEKRKLDEDNIKVVFGIDGGQNKMIATMAVVPNDEKSGKERRQESDYSRRSKSTGCKKCLIVGRVDNVPENRGNVKVLVDQLHLPALQSEFKIVADIKLLDIMCGLQSTSSIHPCPYCTGAKLDKNGRETNGKGTFVKGEPRTMKNLREDAEEYCTNGLQKRAMLRQFNSVEFPPLFVHPDQEEKLVSEIYPPPQLHVGVLGPGNGNGSPPYKRKRPRENTQWSYF